MEDRRALLARRREQAAGCEGYAVPAEPRHVGLGQETTRPVAVLELYSIQRVDFRDGICSCAEPMYVFAQRNCDPVHYDYYDMFIFVLFNPVFR